MEYGQIFYGRHDRTLVLRLVGDIRHTATGSFVTSTALNDFLEARLKARDFDDIVIDLSATQGIDSTHLGLLARTSVILQEVEGRQPTLYTPREKITHLLRAMGFDTVFNLVDSESALVADESLPAAEEDAAVRAPRVVLDAHRTLAALSEKNAIAFKDVVKILEAELGDA